MRLVILLAIYVIIIPSRLMSQPGAIDTTFGNKGWVTNAEGNASAIFDKIGLQPDGQILVSKKNYIGRYTTTGTLDNTFGNNGWQTMLGGLSDWTVQPDGNILVVNGDKVYKYNGSNGSLDQTFGDNGVVTIQLPAVNLIFRSITLDSKGRIVLAGGATFGTSPNITHTTVVARLNSDGNADTEFSGVGIKVQIFGDGKSRSVFKCGVDGNDKIVVGVAVGQIFDKDDIILRYNTDGKLDLPFGGGDAQVDVGVDIVDIAVDRSGRIAYSSPWYITQLLRPRLSYLTDDGTVHGLATMQNLSEVPSIAFQADGKIIAVGSAPISVIRFNINGSFDNTFSGDGTATVQNNGIPYHMINHNRRIFIVGAHNITYNNGQIGTGDGFIIAIDGSNILFTCNSFTAADLQLATDPGKCYATLNNAVKFDPPIPLTAPGTVQYELLRNGFVVEQGTGSVNGRDFPVGTTQVVYRYTDITTQTCTFTINVSDKETPIAKAKNLTVQLNAAGTASITTADIDDNSSDPCGIKSMSLDITTFNCTNVGANTITLTVTDNSNNQSTATATVTVEDKISPVATCKNLAVYLNAAGTVTITPAQIDDGSTDACGIKSLGLDKTTFDCTHKGNNTVTITVTDNNDNSSTCTATVTVLDNLPPVITGVVPTPQAIWPSDRKMKNVTVTTSFTDNCPGTNCLITGVAIKAGEFANDNIGPGWEITGTNTVNLRAEIPKKGVKRIYTVTVTCTDASNNSSSSTTDVIVAHNITTPARGATVRIGSTVNLAGEFWDIPGKKHTAKWLIDDKMINGTVKEPSGMNSGIVTGSYKFTTAGVYKIQMNVTDQNGISSYSNTSENLEAIVVVYDPNGGYTYGGGSFWSTPGNLKNNLSAAGDVSYGFTVNYYKGATLPKGETQFNFKLGEFEYNALNFDYLAILNTKAQFKGTGRIIGGQSGVNFIMTVIDGQLDGTGVDKIRIKIYNKNTGQVYYDNQPGASEAAFPVQAVGANSVIVISGTNSSITSANTNQKAEMESSSAEISSGLDVIAFPNPSATNFTINVKTITNKERIMMQVVDMYGRIIETRNVTANSMIRFGDRYRSGTYFVRIMQGKEHKEIKLVKIID